MYMKYNMKPNRNLNKYINMQLNLYQYGEIKYELWNQYEWFSKFLIYFYFVGLYVSYFIIPQGASNQNYICVT